MRRIPLAVVVWMAIAPAQPVRAQAQGPPPGRLEVAVGASWLGGAHLGEDAATLRGRGGGDFTLFRSDSHLGAAAGLEARVGFALTRRLGVEGRAALARPDVRTDVSADAEGAPPLTLTERVDRYVFDGAALFSLDGLRLGRLTPFASAGAGYVRQLHEGQMFVEEGFAVHVGGGVRQPLFERANALIAAGGVRGDVRLYLMSGGVGIDGRPRPHAAVSGSFFLTF